MIKSYQKFLESQNNNRPTHVGYKDYVSDICMKYHIKNWSINPDTGLVDVDSVVNLNEKGLTELPLKFGKVSDYFTCQVNYLETLEGCPYEVGSGFSCNNNRLKSLEFAPKKVGGDFNCSSNKLTSLEFTPKKVWGSFNCSGNELTSLEGCPTEVGAGFYCANNQLTSLKFAPIIVGTSFWCDNNQIISLEGLVHAGLFGANKNTLRNATTIGLSMILKKITFLEAVMLNISYVSDKELELIFQDIEPQKILDLNDFRIFNLLRTNLPEKYAQVMSLRDISLESDLGELGF